MSDAVLPILKQAFEHAEFDCWIYRLQLASQKARPSSRSTLLSVV